MHEHPDVTNLTTLQKLHLFFWKMLPFIVIAAILISAIIKLVFMIQEKKARLEEKRIQDAKNQQVIKVDVLTTKLQPTELIDNIQLPGVVRPWEELIIQAQVSGKITKILKDEGDFVSKGDPIALIDDRDYVAALNIAQTRLTRIKKDYERTSKLRKKNVVSMSEFEGDEAALLESQSTLELDKLKLERCTIKAPFSGYINNRYIKLGSLVSSGTDIVELLDTRKVRIDVNIPEADIDKVRDLKSALVRIVSLENQSFQAKKVFLSLKPDKNTHSFLLQLAVANKNNILRPGMFVEADIIREHKQGVLLIPLYAVIARGNLTFCYVVEDGIAKMKPVKLGTIKQKTVEILTGLEPNDELIIKGQRQVEANQPVNVIQCLPLKDTTDLVRQALPASDESSSRKGI